MREGYIPPEALAEMQSTSNQEQKEQPTETKASSAEMRPEEQEHQEKLRQEVIHGLATLYELLPRRGEIKPEEVTRLINDEDFADDLSPLNELAPAMRKVFPEIIAEKRLNEEPKDKFVKKGLVILEEWMHMKALGNASTEELAKLQDKLNQDREESDQSAK